VREGDVRRRAVARRERDADEALAARILAADDGQHGEPVDRARAHGVQAREPVAGRRFARRREQIERSLHDDAARGRDRLEWRTRVDARRGRRLRGQHERLERDRGLGRRWRHRGHRDDRGRRDLGRLRGGRLERDAGGFRAGAGTTATSARSAARLGCGLRRRGAIAIAVRSDADVPPRRSIARASAARPAS
jgi:hypothetical protein